MDVPFLGTILSKHFYENMLGGKVCIVQDLCFKSCQIEELGERLLAEEEARLASWLINEIFGGRYRR